MSQTLSPWRSARARHDPGKIFTDLAVAVAVGGDCVADLAVVRAQPGLFGPVASDPTVSRLVATLADDIDTALPAIRAARAQARARAWARCRPLDGQPGTRDGGQVIVDLDVTLVRAHSEKEGAEPTYKRGFGFAPMCAFVDHGEHGSGETLLVDLRHRPSLSVRHRPPTSLPWTPHWPSCPKRSGDRCWSAPTPPARRRRSCTTSATSGCSTRPGSPSVDDGQDRDRRICPQQAWRPALDGERGRP